MGQLYTAVEVMWKCYKNALGVRAEMNQEEVLILARIDHLVVRNSNVVVEIDCGETGMIFVDFSLENELNGKMLSEFSAGNSILFRGEFERYSDRTLFITEGKIIMPTDDFEEAYATEIDEMFRRLEAAEEAGLPFSRMNSNGTIAKSVRDNSYSSSKSTLKDDSHYRDDEPEKKSASEVVEQIFESIIGIIFVLWMFRSCGG